MNFFGIEIVIVGSISKNPELQIRNSDFERFKNESSKNKFTLKFYKNEKVISIGFSPVNCIYFK